MRFGHFLYYSNFDPSRDAEVIEEALNEACLAEELGYEAVWFGERHFLGEMVYGDPIVFATAVAMRTKRIKLGFAVLTMGLYHPVRVAIQTALLDNLSRGRLLVGTSSGGKVSTFEYNGFGTTLETSIEQLEEMEDLLVQAWTTENLHYDGRYWKVAFPAVRPRPWQKPHPPFYRGCMSTESAAEMGRRGRLVLLLSSTPEMLREQLSAYTEAMYSAGFSEEEVERNLDQTWLLREAYVADTTQQALEEYVPGLIKRRELMKRLREPWESKDRPSPVGYKSVEQISVDVALSTGDVLTLSSNMGSFSGSPQQLKEQIAELRDLGVRNLMLTHYGQVVSPEKQANSMRLLSEKVMPAFREPASKVSA